MMKMRDAVITETMPRRTNWRPRRSFQRSRAGAASSVPASTPVPSEPGPLSAASRRATTCRETCRSCRVLKTRTAIAQSTLPFEARNTSSTEYFGLSPLKSSGGGQPSASTTGAPFPTRWSKTAHSSRALCPAVLGERTGPVPVNAALRSLGCTLWGGRNCSQAGDCRPSAERA
jgi:hypothetical protein